MSKKHDTHSQFSLQTRPTLVESIRHNRYIVALDRFFGFHYVTGLFHEGAYDFDFLSWPHFAYVKVFSRLDETLVSKYSDHPEPQRIRFLFDTEAAELQLTWHDKDPIPSCSLSADDCAIVKRVNGYLYCNDRIWYSHSGANRWEPLLPHSLRICYEQDWQLTKPTPLKIKSSRQ